MSYTRKGGNSPSSNVKRNPPQSDSDRGEFSLYIWIGAGLLLVLGLGRALDPCLGLALPLAFGLGPGLGLALAPSEKRHRATASEDGGPITPKRLPFPCAFTACSLRASSSTGSAQVQM